MSHRAKTGSWYCGIYSLNTYLHKRKCGVGGGERQTGKEGVRWEEEMKEERKAERRKERRHKEKEK